MTGVGAFGILLGLASLFFAFAYRSRVRLTIFVLAYLMHIAAAFAYWYIALTGVADSAHYYEDPSRMYEEGFGLNTAFIIYIVQLPKSIFGGTYLDYFLVFQAIGFFGLVFMMRIFEEIYEEVGQKQPPYVYLILFLPSLHYWTSAIGKDALFFFGICMTLWAAMQYRKRMIWLGFGLLLLLLIRPHIAVCAAAAFTMAVLIDRQTRLAIKVPLVALSCVGVVYAVMTVRTAFGIDVTSIDAYTDLLSGREALLETENAGRSAAGGSYPVRVLSLLFRPFFFDAGGLLGLIVSIENLLLAAMTLAMIFRLKTTAHVIRLVPFVRYSILFTGSVTLILALGYYNVGLGIRQKATMILPGLLVAFVAVEALSQARRQSEEPAPVPRARVSLG